MLSPRVRSSLPASSGARPQDRLSRQQAVCRSPRALTSEAFLPQQARWVLESVLPSVGLLPRREHHEVSKQQLAAQLLEMTQERDRALSGARMSRLEAAHLRGEKERLHRSLTTLQADSKLMQAKAEALQKDLDAADHIQKASLWHSYCSARKKLLGMQDTLTDKQSETHRLLSHIKQEEAANRALRAQLAAAEQEKAALLATLETSQECTALVKV